MLAVFLGSGLGGVLRYGVTAAVHRGVLSVGNPRRQCPGMRRGRSGSAMTLRENHALLRVFVPESDRFDYRPAWLAAVEHLRLSGIAGATAYRGCAGYAGGGPVASDTVEVLSGALPIVVEAVDLPERIDAVLDEVAAVVGAEGLVTVERVEVVPRGRGASG